LFILGVSVFVTPQTRRRLITNPSGIALLVLSECVVVVVVVVVVVFLFFSFLFFFSGDLTTNTRRNIWSSPW